MYTRDMPIFSITIRPRERDAIIKSFAAGVAPTIGLHHIQVDRKDEIMAMIGDLERVKEGGASFRFVIGKYGTGKSFFLNLTKTVALAEKFVVLQADITQQRRLVSTTGYARNLYAALLGSMSAKARPEGGAVDFVLEKWVSDLREKYGETFDAMAVVRDELKPLQDLVGGYHFTLAVTKYCEARLSGSEGDLRSSKKWLMGGYDKVTAAKAEIAIDSHIGDKDIYDYLKLWGAFARIAGFSGMLILLDEMGALTHALSNNTARTGNYEIILHILNDCLQGRMSGVGFMFAGVDYFLDDPKNGLMSHDALASRLAPNPFARDGLKDLSTPIIRLGEFSPEDLYLLFENIRGIFAMGDKSKYLIPDEAIHSFMNLCAWSLGPEFYRTPRDAVKLFTGFLSVLEQNSQIEWRNLLERTVIKPGPDAVHDRQPEFDLTPDPGLYVVEAGASLYDPEILHIMPDAGSPSDASLQKTAVQEIPHPPGVAEETPEEDMREGNILHGNENDLKVFLPNLISRNPLIGMGRIPAGIHNDLVKMSRKILINAHKNYPPNSYEKMLLTVTLINIAKRFPLGGEEAFRNFITRQLGFDKYAYETICETMFNAVCETMESHHRFFSRDPGTDKIDFYSTMMTHALSPRDGMFVWFDFLMDFYGENLRGVVIKNDPATRVMTDVLRDMLKDASGQGGLVLKTRRFAIQPEIFTLLLKRPAYFKKLTCEILERMDRLASGAEPENKTYIDELLTCWFEKSPPQITRAEPIERPSRRIAASYDAIRPRYEMENSNLVVLVIPSLRIGERIRDCREVTADIRCGDDNLRANLDLFGDEFGWTISEKRIPLSDISGLKSTRDLRIRIKILIDERIIYDSGALMYRDVIIFEGEHEIQAGNVGAGLYCVFASSEAEITFDPTADARIVPVAAGQMRAVKFERGYRIEVNGRIVCSDYRNEAARIIASSEPRPDLSFVLRGEVYDVWAGDLSVRIRIPSGRDLRAYSLKTGDRYFPLNRCDMRTDGGIIEYQLSVTGDMITGHVFDVALAERGIHERELYRRGFCLLNEINVAFDKPYYFEDAGGGMMTIESGTERAEVALDNGEFAFARLGEGYIRMKAPIVSWRLEQTAGESDAFGGTGTVWRDDIPADCKVIVTCPDGVGCKLNIGESAVFSRERDGETVFAVGAALRTEAFGWKEDIVHAELVLWNEEYSSSHILFPVCKRETFKEAPRFEMRDSSLILKNPLAFAGPRGAMLEYAFTGRSGKSYIVEAGEPIISENCGLPHGRYDYKIFLLPDVELWQRKYVISSGSCVLGDADIFHFDNKLLEIRRVRSGFREFFILPVYIENLAFVETKVPFDDNASYPMYSGMCFNINRDDEKIYFGEGFNPVLIAIINGRDICMYKQDGEKPYLIFESRHKLAASKPDENSGVMYYVPDFCEYELLDGNWNEMS